ncbi:MAG: hypothetical protein QF619_01820 [Candidatus Binatia bacterium]|jgi:hypothetical protein|nr:hypothetical protein [Candidatus Binatia bacterium]
MDALHTLWFHTAHSGPQFPSDSYGSVSQEFKYEEIPMGMRFLMTRKLPNSKWWDVAWEMIMPLNAHLVYGDEPKTEKVRAVSYCLPVDDTRQFGAVI